MKNHANFKFKQSESEIKKCIANYLQILENQSKLYFVRNNSFEGKIIRNNKTEGYIKNNKKGTPDFLLCIKSKFVGIFKERVK